VARKFTHSQARALNTAGEKPSERASKKRKRKHTSQREKKDKGERIF
jgi:hypothetical protein